MLRVRTKNQFKFIAILFFLLHGALVYGLSYRLHGRLASNPEFTKRFSFSPHLERMDSGYYRGIAKNGYQFPGLSGEKGAKEVDRVFYEVEPDKNNVAFFPLYPYLARGFVVLGVPVEWALTLVSWIACFLLWNLWFCSTFEKAFGKNAQFWGGLSLLFFPTSFYLWTSYSEGVVLAVTLLALKAFFEEIDSKGPPFRTAAVFAIWGLAKITVVPVALAVMLLCLSRSPDRKAFTPSLKIGGRWLAWLGISFSGLFAFLAYCGIRFGEPMLYTKLQRYSWHHSDAGIGALFSLDNLVGTLFKAQTNANGFFAFVPMIIGLVALARPDKYVRASGVFILAVMLTVYCGVASDYMVASIRYALMAIPMFFIIGKWFAGIQSRYIRILVAVIFFYGGFYWSRAWFEVFLSGEFLA